MTFFAKDGPTDLRLERDLIVLSAIVANDLKALGAIGRSRCLF
jgi:hypothetical protein